jgi:outer membrane lipoprotein LolB
VTARVAPRFAIAGLIALLAGCASLAPPPSGVERLSGRLSVQVDNDASRSFNASFELLGTAEQGSLSLSTPLGNQVAQADWSAQQVRLRSSDGERLYPDLDSLAVDALGERVPLAALFDWLRGRPWPAASHAPRADGFAQLGWQIDLARHAEGWVQAQRDAVPVVTVRAKLDTP